MIEPWVICVGYRLAHKLDGRLHLEWKNCMNEIIILL